MFVYLRARSQLLRDPDRLQEISLNLSKKKRTVPAVCVTVGTAMLFVNIAAHISSTFCSISQDYFSIKWS